MAIAINAAGLCTAAFTTATHSWTVTPNASALPRRVGVLFVVQNAGVTDEVTGATWDAVAMNEVALSPWINDVGAEDGVLYGYFLDNIPTGAVTVSVMVNATGSAKRAGFFVWNTDRACVVEDTSVLEQASGANPSVNLDVNPNFAYGCCAAIHSGHQAVADIEPASPWANRGEFDFGSQVCGFADRTAGPGVSTIAANWTALTEEAGILALAFREVAASLVPPKRRDRLVLPTLVLPTAT